MKIVIILILLVAGGVIIEKEEEGKSLYRESLSAERRARSEDVTKAKQEGAAKLDNEQKLWSAKFALLNRQLALLDGQFERYRAEARSNPAMAFAAFGNEVRGRAIHVKAVVDWKVSFYLNQALASGEYPMENRGVTESNSRRTQSVPLFGFVLGRRSHFLFALVALGKQGSGLQVPDAAFLQPPRDATIYVPEAFTPNKQVGYSLQDLTASLEIQGFRECEGHPVGIVHSWTNRYFDALVLGCETAEAPDKNILAYEDFTTWTRLTGRDVVFPYMTPDGEVAMAWNSLDRKYAEEGSVGPGLGPTNSLGVTFLPLDESKYNPVIHSVFFQMDEERVWIPFWSLRKQLAAAQEDFDINRSLTFSNEAASARILPEGACDPILRGRMLTAFRNLVNVNTPFERN